MTFSFCGGLSLQGTPWRFSFVHTKKLTCTSAYQNNDSCAYNCIFITDAYKLEVLSELKKQYEEFWKINIKRSSKLDTYSSFKSSFCAESYPFTIKKIKEKA